jgi:zinc transport system substrate-binding protein
VTSAGALTLNPDVLPGAKQIADIQDLIRDKGIKCIFSEPQYNPKIIETLGNDMNTYTGVMDPLGAFIDAGPTMYVELINGIANSIKECH